MADILDKWAPGPNYGPVLEPTHLYLLQTELELHPILKGVGMPSFVFNLATGSSGMFNASDRERDLPFTKKREPATLPRVTELTIITRLSPWCTTVRNESGVTLENVCGQLWTDYGESFITEAEFEKIPPRLQEQVKRTASGHQANGAWPPYASPAPGVRYRRSDFLRNMMCVF
ncbi:hypothetical protein JB92DRAFT_444510 [Gautieria morchelliformis]|nr:hypothetical protein JB92DRAFT_444510 [Gautieria morchelliformis]